jgi:peptide/nickel transport system substrate-binding protein
MRLRTFLALLAAIAAVAVAVTALPAGAQDDGAKKKVLKLGWAQDVQTLNPFVAQDEENFRVWALNWDLLVGFNPDDLAPGDENSAAPGFAESWDISDDKKTVTFHLIEGAKWSDGQPITSKDVKYSLDVLGGNGLIFSGYTDNVTKVDTPDDNTVVIHTKQPDARIVGGLFIYMIPEHVYGKVPVKQLKGNYQPELPMVGSGPYMVTDFERGRILKMERNPNFRGEKPQYDEIQFIKYGTTDAVIRALKLGEIDGQMEVEPTGFNQLENADNIEPVRSSSPSFTELSFNLCSKEHCPNGKANPGVKDVAVRQAVGYAVDRERVNEISSRGTSFVGHGLLPSYYESFYSKPADDYPYDPDKAKQLLDDAGYTLNGDGIRQKGDVTLSFDLFVRSESPSDIQAAKVVAEQSKEVGIDFKVQVVSVDKLTEITTQFEGDKPAPDFDTFIWGWGGDPYDPSALLKLITTDQIGNTSDSFYSNPEYDRLFTEQTGEFDQAKRKEIVQEMIAIAQRDLPYLVLTEDPVLEAYRTDRIANVELQCPKPDGDAFCQQVSYAPLLTMEPASGDSDGGGSSAGIFIAIGVVVLALLAFVFLRRRRGGGREPLELET